MIDSRKILISGSSRLNPDLIPFVEGLGRSIILNTDFQIITGGLQEREKGIPTTDFVVASGAMKGVEEIKCDPQERIITMLPQELTNDFKRFRFGKVIEVHKSNLKSRRFSMVLSSDAVVTIGGLKGTKEIIDLAWISGKLILPIAATSNNSEERWKKYRSDIISRLKISAEEIEILETKPIIKESAIKTCITLLRRFLRPRCFIAMKFGKHPLVNCYETIYGAIEQKGYTPVRVDQELFNGSIVDAIWDAIRSSEYVIADLTDGNPNVFYELGISHALGKQTILTIFDKYGRVPDGIPFDIKVQRILPYGTQSTLISQIEKHLPEVK